MHNSEFYRGIRIEATTNKNNVIVFYVCVCVLRGHVGETVKICTHTKFDKKQNQANPLGYSAQG